MARSLQMNTNDTADHGGMIEVALKLHGKLQESFCDALSKELHRDICQKLTAAKLELDILALDQQESESLQRARSALSDGIRSLRELMEALAEGYED